MNTWQNRPIEVRNLFNPAFSALNIYNAVKEYEKVSGEGMPFSLSLLILPLCFHEPTSSYLLSNNRTYFLKNVTNNPLILSGLDLRIRDLNLYTIEAINFLLYIDAISIANNGKLKTHKVKLKNLKLMSQLSLDKIKVASYLGKQLAKIHDRSTIYISLGIRP